MTKVITVKLWNRPDLTQQCLDHLQQCWGIEDYHLYLSVDHSEVQSEIIEIIETHPILDSVHASLMYHDKNLGCAGNARHCFEFAFNTVGAALMIHLEDDILAAPDFLAYCEHCQPLLDSGSYFTACGFNRPCHEKQKPYSEGVGQICAKHWFDGTGGFCMVQSQWERIEAMGGMFGVNSITPKGRGPGWQGEEWLMMVKESDKGSWVWPFHKFFSEGKPSLFPMVSRTLNVGKAGLHVMSDAQHTALHHNPNWTGGEYEPTAEFFDEILEDERLFVEDGIL